MNELAPALVPAKFVTSKKSEANFGMKTLLVAKGNCLRSNETSVVKQGLSP